MAAGNQSPRALWFTKVLRRPGARRHGSAVGNHLSGIVLTGGRAFAGHPAAWPRLLISFMKIDFVSPKCGRATNFRHAEIAWDYRRFVRANCWAA
jgi:hypothetical protein